MTPETIASLTTAGGTLVLAVATFTAGDTQTPGRWIASIGTHWLIDDHASG